LNALTSLTDQVKNKRNRNPNPTLKLTTKLHVTIKGIVLLLHLTYYIFLIFN
jgi:hypothetical protein